MRFPLETRPGPLQGAPEHRGVKGRRTGYESEDTGLGSCRRSLDLLLEESGSGGGGAGLVPGRVEGGRSVQAGGSEMIHLETQGPRDLKEGVLWLLPVVLTTGLL